MIVEQQLYQAFKNSSIVTSLVTQLKSIDYKLNTILSTVSGKCITYKSKLENFIGRALKQLKKAAK
jgi:hypothetical protein